MLTLGNELISKPILSLRTSSPVGVATEVIINPNNLKIEGWHALDTNDKREGILLSQDVRDILPKGFAVNDHEAISDPADLVRLQKVLDIKFEIIGKPVITTNKKKLGKVSDYAFEKNAFFIQKIYVSQSILKNFSGGGLVIDRSQVVEITHRQIVVREATVRDEAPLQAPVAA
jgi:uncharacterized protein YrrD